MGIDDNPVTENQAQEEFRPRRKSRDLSQLPLADDRPDWTPPPAELR